MLGNSMQEWSVSRRIYSGFAITLGLMILLAVVSLFATWNISSVFTEYRAKARQSLVVNSVIEDLFEARISAYKYRIRSSSAVAEEVQSKIKDIRNTQPAVEQLFKDEPEWASVMEELTKESERYASAFANMSALQMKREELVSLLVSIGPKARKQLTSVMETAYRDNDANAAYYAGIAQQDLMLGRFYAERYLLTNSDQAFSEAISKFNAATEGLNALLQKLKNPTRRDNTHKTLDDIELYRDTFAEIKGVIGQRNRLRSEELDTLGPKMQVKYEEIINHVVDQQNVLGPSGEWKSKAVLLIVLVIAIASMAIGAFLALKISNSVTSSVKDMAASMDKLANGDFDLEITGSEQKHELGLMAQALAIFRTNGLRIRKLAQEKEEADKLAAQERQEELKRVAMMDELQSELRRVVDSAVAGNFSERVPTFPDPTLNALAERVNLLLETTEEGLCDAVKMLGAMSKGDLSARIEAEYQGDFSELKDNANKTSVQLAKTISEIQVVAGTVKETSRNINGSNIDLQQRTEDTARNIKKTASNMADMTVLVRKNAESAHEANKLVIEASDTAKGVSTVINDAIEAMSSISEASGRISDIITVIDEIAFQTNLLALNASVEAARAGGQGRGFAVVASEVRNLAGRSATAAQEIKALINDSVGRVDKGTELVNKSGESLANISKQVLKVTDIVAEITDASQSQSTGIEQVNESISQLDDATQKNTLLVEEVTKNSQSSAEQADTLTRLIGFFKIDATPANGQGDRSDVVKLFGTSAGGA